MAADRLSALQERVSELLRSKDAHVAFAAGGILGCASAALAAVWLHRRKRARPASVHGLALQRAAGLTAVLDLSASWTDEHLAVCALSCRKLQLTALSAVVDVDMHQLVGAGSGKGVGALPSGGQALRAVVRCGSSPGRPLAGVRSLPSLQLFFFASAHAIPGELDKRAQLLT